MLTAAGALAAPTSAEQSTALTPKLSRGGDAKHKPFGNTGPIFLPNVPSGLKGILTYGPGRLGSTQREGERVLCLARKAYGARPLS
jgi:hypothetical protein